MIRLTCTKCQKVLEIDDGFAGGVCRCQHCGTIQTVPAHLKSKKPSAVRKGPKTLYSSAPRGEAIPSSGLDELAQVVVSSGLTSERLRGKPLPAAGTPTRRRMLLLIGAGTLLLIGIAVGTWLAMGEAEDRGTVMPGPIAEPSRQGAAVAPAGDAPDAVRLPHAFGVPISERSVIYVLDRGSGTSDLFSYLKQATFRSIESLGGDRRFQVIFWNNGADDAYPRRSPTFATPTNIEAARRALDSIVAHGQTDIGSAMTHAVGSSPEVIVIVTGKGWQLDESFVDQVMSIRGDRKIRIHTIDLGGPDASAALAAIAQRGGGESRVVGEAELKRLAKE